MGMGKLVLFSSESQGMKYQKLQTVFESSSVVLSTSSIIGF